MSEKRPPFLNEDTILEKGELYRSIVENSPDLITRWDKELKLIYANPAFSAKMGIAGESLYGKTCREIGQPLEIASPWMESLQKVFRTGKAVEHFNICHTPGGLAHFYYRMVPEKNDKGKVETVLATGRDITRSKRAEMEVLRVKNVLAQQATDKYLSIFNSIDEGFHLTELIFDENGKAVDLAILEENPAAKKIFGESFVGKTIRQIRPEYDQSRLEVWAEVARSGKNQHLTRYSDIWKKWFDFHLTRIGGENSNQVVSIFRDITEQKQAEEALIRSEEKLAADIADTKRLQLISSRLVEHDNLQKIYEEILNAAMDFMHSDAGSIHILYPEKDELRLLASKGFHTESARCWETVEARSGSACGITLAQNKRTIIPDIEAWEFTQGKKDRDAYRLSGIRAVQSTPLVSRSGHMVGTICTHWHKIYQPSEHQFHLLDVLARQVADLLERKQKEEALRKSQESLATDLADTKQLQSISSQLIQEDNVDAIYEQLLKAATTIMHSEMATMQLWVPEKNELLLLAHKGLDHEVMKFFTWVKIGGQSTCGTALKKNNRVIIPDIETSEFINTEENRAAHRMAGIRCGQSTPLITRSGDIIGMISTHWKTLHEPTERELNLMDVLARQAADLLERRQKADALRNSRERLVADLADTKQLQSISGQLIQEDNIEAIYDHLLKAATTIMHSEMATMQILVPEKNELLLLAHKGFDPEVIKFWTWVKMGGQSACGAALKENKRIIIRDIEISEFINTEENRAAHRMAGIRSAQSTPLITRSGDMIGMISTLWNTVHEPTERELNLLDVLARQAADLLERRQKEDALRKSQERLVADLADTKQLQSISSLLIQEDNTAAIYEQLLNAAMAIMHSEQGCIQLLFPERDELLLLTYKGFGPKDAEAWKWVRRGSATSCGQAFERNERIIVPDIESCEFMIGTVIIEAYRLSNVRSMQSTPLITRSGHIIGMVTTHWNTVHEPTERELNLLDILARQTADLFERKAREEKYLSRLQDEVHERTKELNASKGLLQNIANLIPDLISVKSYPSGKLIYINRGHYTAHGIDPHDYTKMSFEEREYIIHPDDQDGLKKYMAGVVGLSDTDIATFEFRAKPEPGDWLWFRKRGRVFERDADRRVISFINILQNISAEKEAEMELKNSKELLQNIAEAIPDMISVQGYPSRKMIYYNREPYSVNGLSGDELSKMSVEERHRLVHPDDMRGLQTYIAAVATLSNEDIANVEYRVKSKLRDWIWLRSRGKVFERDKEGKVTSFINVVQNVTTEKEAEQVVVDLNNTLLAKNEDLETLNSELKTFNKIAAKDYKETIQILYTNLEYIVSNEARNLSNASKANIRKAQGAIQRMKLLTEDINSYLALYDHEVNTSVIDPNPLLKNVLMQLSGKIEKAEAIIETMDMPPLRTDPFLFSLLMTNLIDNTIKFRKPTENPIIKITCSASGKLNGSKSGENGAYVVVSVSDNGIGIDEKVKDKIFELFYTAHDKTKYRGSGIGLATCRKIMVIHNGFIKAVSNAGQGMVINCYFPSTS